MIYACAVKAKPAMPCQNSIAKTTERDIHVLGACARGVDVDSNIENSPVQTARSRSPTSDPVQARH